MITELQVDITFDQILTIVKQLPAIDKIKLAARNGCRLIYIFDVLPEPIVEKLEKDGFLVTHTSHRNESETTISW